MNPSPSFPVTTDSVTGPASPQYWVPPAQYGWDANPSPTTPDYYYSYYPNNYSTDVQTFDPTIYSYTPGYNNFNYPPDHTFHNHYFNNPATTPSGSPSMQPTPSTTPSTPIAQAKPALTKIPKVKSTAKGIRKCSNCFTTNSCRWKNIRTKSNILCNTCFVHKQRTGEDRSAKAIIAHNAMQMKLNK